MVEDLNILFFLLLVVYRTVWYIFLCGIKINEREFLPLFILGCFLEGCYSSYRYIFAGV